MSFLLFPMESRFWRCLSFKICCFSNMNTRPCVFWYLIRFEWGDPFAYRYFWRERSVDISFILEPCSFNLED